MLLDACRYFMADAYPMEIDFVQELPEHLGELFNDWASRKGFDPMTPNGRQGVRPGD